MDLATLQHNFELYDSDRSGFITIDELHKIYIKFGLNTSRDTLVYLMRKYDKDGDGKINFREFCELIGGGQGSTSQAQPIPNRQPAYAMPGQCNDPMVAMTSQRYSLTSQTSGDYQFSPNPVRGPVPQSQQSFNLPPGFENAAPGKEDPNLNPFEALGQPVLLEQGNTPQDSDEFTMKQFQKMQNSHHHIENHGEFARNPNTQFTDSKISQQSTGLSSFGGSSFSGGSLQYPPAPSQSQIPFQSQGPNLFYDSMHPQQDDLALRPAPPGRPPHRGASPQGSPQGLPQGGPHDAPQGAHYGLPQGTPQGIPQGAPQGPPQRQPPAHRNPSQMQAPSKLAPLPGNSAYSPTNADSVSPSKNVASFSTFLPAKETESPAKRQFVDKNTMGGTYATATTFESMLSDDKDSIQKAMNDKLDNGKNK